MILYYVCVPEDSKLACFPVTRLAIYYVPTKYLQNKANASELPCTRHGARLQQPSLSPPDSEHTQTLLVHLRGLAGENKFMVD